MHAWMHTTQHEKSKPHDVGFKDRYPCSTCAMQCMPLARSSLPLAGSAPTPPPPPPNTRSLSVVAPGSSDGVSSGDDMFSTSLRAAFVADDSELDWEDWEDGEDDGDGGLLRRLPLGLRALGAPRRVFFLAGVRLLRDAPPALGLLRALDASRPRCVFFLVGVCVRLLRGAWDVPRLVFGLAGVRLLLLWFFARRSPTPPALPLLRPLSDPACELAFALSAEDSALDASASVG